jgi:hypothetical protein
MFVPAAIDCTPFGQKSPCRGSRYLHPDNSITAAYQKVWESGIYPPKVSFTATMATPVNRDILLSFHRLDFDVVDRKLADTPEQSNSQNRFPRLHGDSY